MSQRQSYCCYYYSQNSNPLAVFVKKTLMMNLLRMMIVVVAVAVDANFVPPCQASFVELLASLKYNLNRAMLPPDYYTDWSFHRKTGVVRPAEPSHSSAVGAVQVDWTGGDYVQL